MRRAILIAASLMLFPGHALAERPADVAAAPGTETWPDDDGLWVRRHLTVSLDAAGKISTEVEQAIKPYTGHPMREDMLDPRIDWNDARATLEVLDAVTWMVDGTEVRALDNSFVPNTAGVMQWAVPYAHMRQLTVAHVGVEHGSTSLLHYRVADRGALGMPMWGQQPLADFIPIQSQRVILQVPTGTPLHWGVLNGAAQPEKSIQGELTQLVFQDLAVPGLVLHENHGEAGVPTLIWSSSPSWSATRSYLEAQVEPSTLADSYLLAKVEEVLDGSLTQAEQIARIHNFVVDGVRSIDWPPLDFGYATRSAPEVLSSSVGHPLDKAVLLVAMLRAAGFEAHVAFASPHRAWLPEVPSPVPFEQVWVRVDAGHHAAWLDPTASVAAHNRFHLAGKPVLVLDGASDAPIVVRELDADHNHAQVLARLELSAADGGLAASGHADLDLAGLYCPVLGFDRGNDQAAGAADGVASIFGGGGHEAVVAVQTAGYLALGADFEGGSFEPAPSGLITIELPRVPGAISGAALQSYREARTLPIELAGPARELVVLEITLPDGWEIIHQPAPISIDNAAGRFVRAVEDDGEGGLVLTHELELTQAVIAPEDWPALRTLLNASDAAAGRTLLLRPSEGGE
jgi:hypothetical protein